MKNIRLIVASRKVLLPAYSSLLHDGVPELCDFRIGRSMWECIVHKAVPASHSFGIK